MCVKLTCTLPPDGARRAISSISRITDCGTISLVNSRMERRVSMAALTLRSDMLLATGVRRGSNLPGIVKHVPAQPAATATPPRGALQLLW